MIASIKEFFNQLIEPGIRQAGADGEHALRIATADLLHVGHADYVAAKQRAREAAAVSPAPAFSQPGR